MTNVYVSKNPHFLSVKIITYFPAFVNRFADLFRKSSRGIPCSARGEYCFDRSPAGFAVLDNAFVFMIKWMRTKFGRAIVMATDTETIQKLGDLFAEAGVTCRKMFGEYGLYCEGKYFAVVCDNELFVKPTASARRMLANAPMKPPYAGAKPMYVVEDWSDAGFLCDLARQVAAELPAPKKKGKE